MQIKLKKKALIKGVPFAGRKVLTVGTDVDRATADHLIRIGELRTIPRPWKP